ncbi:MAG: FKBP-type peptidyl-prolyl cis-trans isomerase [Phycisphaerales bacterium]|nr:FKBP-type peptidyl-prolyl cis-trans isomerase [Phycisphaerales bacterium]
MHKTPAFAVAGLLLLGALSPAGAQQQPAAEPAAASAPQPMVWTDPDFEAIGKALSGNWKTTAPVGQFGDASATADVLMSIAPASLADVPNALYVECARADSVDHPYRASFLQLYRREGKIRMRTLEVRDPNSPLNNLLIGLWAAPEYIPQVRRDVLIATLDMNVTKGADGWVAETPYPYPTALGGAFEMTSRMKIGNGRLETSDRGYDANGKVVWGASEGDKYTFEHTDAPFGVTRNENGLVVITLRQATGEQPSAEGDTVAFQYTGWLTNGVMFDTSRRQGKRPLQYVVPGSMIEGWTRATEGMAKGDWRKFIVPAELAWGPSSAAGGAIPANSTVIFEAECVFLQPAAAGAGEEDGH